jgi:hypothetical protein
MLSTTDAKSTYRRLIHLLAVGSRQIAASIVILLVGSVIAAIAIGCGGEQSTAMAGRDNASHGTSSGARHDNLERAMRRGLTALHEGPVLSVRCEDVDSTRRTGARCAVTSRDDDGRIAEQIYDVKVGAHGMLHARGEKISFFWCCVGARDEPSERLRATPQ